MITNKIIESGGRLWKIRQAKSMEHAESAISMARVSGSVGSKSVLDGTLCDGTREVLADVVQINSDGSERQPYTESY